MIGATITPGSIPIFRIALNMLSRALGEAVRGSMRRFRS